MVFENNCLDIILPCYNPNKNFIEILAVNMAKLQKHYPDLSIHPILVNDGSPHNFGKVEQAKLIEAIPEVTIVNLPQNQGKGGAVRAGIAISKAKYTIYTDVDMPYSLETITKVIDQVIAGTDVVIAVRNKSYYSKLSIMRKLMSHGSKLLNLVFLRIKHTDTQGGLKGLSIEAKKLMMKTKINDFLFDTEFIVLASRDKKIKITEVEAILGEHVELSKMSSKVMFRELRNFFRIAFLKL